MRRHSLDPLSLAFGLVFCGIGGLALVGGVDVSLVHLRWVAAGGLLVFGLTMLLSSRGREDDGPARRDA